MLTKLCRSALLLLLLASCTSAQQNSPGKVRQALPIDSAYYPGYASYGTPLARFVRPEMRSACDALIRDDTQTALALFQRETTTHSDDLPAYIGLIQAMPRPVRESYLAQYQQDAKDHDDAANQFKLGVLAWYLLGAHLPDYGPQADILKNRLSQIVRTALPRAYSLSHAPAVGFSLADADMIVGKDSLPVYEDMLRRIGGAVAYTAYVRAKNNHWVGPSPPVPHVPREQLFVVSRVVANIWSTTGAQSTAETTRFVNGKLVTTMGVSSPRSATQKRGMAYLMAWKQRLKKAVGQANIGSAVTLTRTP